MSLRPRQHPRYRMGAECRVTRGDELVSDRVLDASEEGLRVRALREVRLSDAVRLELRIPGSDAWVEAEGEVTRVVMGRRADDDGPSFAIRLRRIGPIGRRVLASAACWFPETRGSRVGTESDREG